MAELSLEAWGKANERCCHSVGKYMQKFAHAEGSLDQAIAVAFGLKKIQSVIIAVNTPINQKINAIKIVLPYTGLGDKKIKHFTRHINRLADASGDRNIIVHYSFGPSEDGTGVRFYAVTAKGELSFPNTQWSFGNFGQKINRLTELDKKFEALRSELEENESQKKITASFLDPSPRKNTGSPGLLSLLSPRIPTLHYSDTASTKIGKSSQTPPSGGEKS